MSNATRMCRRQQWREDHPPHFNVAQKQRAAAMLGRKLAPRHSFKLWCIEKLNPTLWSKLLDKALGKQVKEGDAQVDADGQTLLTADGQYRLDLDINTIAKRLDESHGVTP